MLHSCNSFYPSRQWPAVVLIGGLCCVILALANYAGAEDAASVPKADNPNRVLRHAVFFKFKKSSSKDDVQRAVEAFGGLPAKIDAIAEYEAGPNIGPEHYSDGLTHCFFVTFKDEKGRDTYLPHPDHKAFVEILRPHLEKVFVLDYWGKRQPEQQKDQLKHLVFFKFSKDASAGDVKAIEEAFVELPGKIPAIKAFEWGTNNSPERFDDGFTHCFALSFDSKEGLAEYAEHPDHKAFAGSLKPTVEKIRVFDFWAKASD